MYTLIGSLIFRLLGGPFVAIVLVAIQEIDRSQWADTHPGEPWPSERERWTGKDYARKMIQNHLARRRQDKLDRIAAVLHKKIL